ncbi:RNA pseudouridylate synthase [Candidatus Tiddalikarchaeum anstoanum]|nr:RNA pseudouridylate synthase [Candidatus Tiddalikarchaeum anstoanum]
MKLRIRQFLSRSGFFKSKKEVNDALIEGSITLSGNELVKSPSYQFNPKKKNVYYNGKLIKPFRKDVYVVMNKPRGYLSATKLSEEEKNFGKKSVFELLTDIDFRTKKTLVCAGRLDENTTGLLIITNDGDLVNTITNPDNNITKKYKVFLDKPLSRDDIRRITEGVTIKLEEEGRIIPYKTKKCKIEVLPNNQVFITISEGKKREVKRIFEAVNNNVLSLERVAIGSLYIDKLDINEGEYKLVDKDFIIEKLGIKNIK